MRDEFPYLFAGLFCSVVIPLVAWYILMRSLATMATMTVSNKSLNGISMIFLDFSPSLGFLTVVFRSFMGSNIFCIKACDPTGKNASSLCQHIYDRIGCAYNAPNAAKNGTFESCEGEDQDPPGVYTSDGKVMTYTQPPESLGPIKTLPYTPRIPASSKCVTFQSTQLFSASSPTAATTNVVGASSGVSTRSSPTAASKLNGAISLTSSSLMSLAAVTIVVFFA